MKKTLLILMVMLLSMQLIACGSAANEAVITLQSDLETPDGNADAALEDAQSEPPATPENTEEENARLDEVFAAVANQNMAGVAGRSDVDLTILSSTMVYAEVYNMMTNPEAYIGRRVKMTGAFSVYEDETTGKIYFACIIADATACCSQGLEFVLKGDYTYPDDYPEANDVITVSGIFDVYEENGYPYCQLIDAQMEQA